MSDVKSVLLVGVGGQGTILASKILTMGLIENGYDVKMSEVHGMSQRGGSVSTQVRFGKKVYSPIIGEGTADLLVSFEEMEAARYAKYLKKDGKIVVNTYRIPSMPILSGSRTYPEHIVESLSEQVPTMSLDATKIATDLGNPKSANVVLLGALIKAIGMTDIDWKAIIAKAVKPKFIEVNQKAFDAGFAAV
ncbi:indolepyruvate oxidoreductase subunit beta [Megasphaera hexanoica]|uniref:Indolepyruvate oxidoreductase subunit beta n=1 Tax=Megasphaera hexanoica TaxID=1675036 RepID=A0ABW7DRW0_9FIRM|nr:MULTISPECIES: indolepyruvate oxidoreductase subunit beta [Megasphaera]AXB81219.1 indolepyruvate oxidoreductase subunit beta [Megasphaera hexanoica]MCI5532047.1 indolepyruvate oxidoreductase subunit beta [Caecibacter massiliensis]